MRNRREEESVGCEVGARRGSVTVKLESWLRAAVIRCQIGEESSGGGKSVDSQKGFGRKNECAFIRYILKYEFTIFTRLRFLFWSRVEIF